MKSDDPNDTDLADLALFGPATGDPSRCRDADAIAVALARAAGSVAPPAAVRSKLLDRLPAGPPPFVRRADEGSWEAWRIPGAARRVLFVDRHNRRATLLLRLAPGGQVPAHRHRGVEELYILEGDIQDADGNVLRAGDYQRSEAGTTHARLWSVSGCTALMIASLGGDTLA